MKWISLMGMVLFITGCGYTTTEVVEYRQVAVVPVVEPISFGPEGPMDITTTTVDFY